MGGAGAGRLLTACFAATVTWNICSLYNRCCCLSGLLFLSPDGLKEQVSEEVCFPSQWKSQIIGEAAWQEGKGAYLLIHLPSTWPSVCQTRSERGVAFTLHLRKSFSSGKSSEVCMAGQAEGSPRPWPHIVLMSQPWI